LSQKLIGHFFKVRKKEIFMTITPAIATTNAAESTVKKELVISFAGLQRDETQETSSQLGEQGHDDAIQRRGAARLGRIIERIQ
jgi:hypothetical protein